MPIDIKKRIRYMQNVVCICAVFVPLVSFGNIMDMWHWGFREKDINSVIVNKFKEANIPYTDMYVGINGVYYFDFSWQPISNLNTIVEILSHIQDYPEENAIKEANTNGFKMSLIIKGTEIDTLSPLTNIVVHELFMIGSKISKMESIRDVKVEKLWYSASTIVSGIEEIRQNPYLKYINGMNVSNYWDTYDNWIRSVKPTIIGGNYISIDKENGEIRKAGIRIIVGSCLILVLLVVLVILHKKQKRVRIA